MLTCSTKLFKVHAVSKYRASGSYLLVKKDGQAGQNRDVNEESRSFPAVQKGFMKSS